MHKILAIYFTTLVLLSPATAQQPSSGGNWKPLAWLIGDWIGSGGGTRGQASGSFSFEPDLQGKILVRRSFAEYPAVADKPAYRHDDLMVVYREGRGFKAIYFDNEENVIRYAINVSADGGVVEFVTEATPAAPRFRLTYRKTGETTLAGELETAPPGKPFATYLEWTAQKKPAK
jgi:hypothetical protein